MLMELFLQARIRGVVSFLEVQLGSVPRKSKTSTASVQSAVMACISAELKSVSSSSCSRMTVPPTLQTQKNPTCRINCDLTFSGLEQLRDHMAETLRA